MALAIPLSLAVPFALASALPSFNLSSPRISMMRQGRSEE